MTRTFTMTCLSLLLITGIAFAQGPGPGDGTGTGECKFIDEDGDGFNDLAPDHDGDGIPNGLDPDYERPQDGTGKQFKHQKGKLGADAIEQGFGPNAQKMNKKGKMRALQSEGAGKGYGPGDGTGTGIGPGDGTGFGPGTGVCDGTGEGNVENRRKGRR